MLIGLTKGVCDISTKDHVGFGRPGRQIGCVRQLHVLAIQLRIDLHGQVGEVLLPPTSVGLPDACLVCAEALRNDAQVAVPSSLHLQRAQRILEGAKQ